jgi:hypothetical protein
MSLIITRRPEKIYSPSAKYSRWTALFNPYLFEFRRVDYGVITITVNATYNPTLPTIQTNGDPLAVPFFVEAGDQIYLNSAPYIGIYTVFSVTDEYITINTPYISVGAVGYLNLIDRLQNYKSLVNIYDAVTNDLIDTLRNAPDTTGNLILDISGVIRSIMVTEADPQQSAINQANKGISGSFYIGYGSTWNYVYGGTSTPVTSPEVIDGDIYYWLSAARQITGDISAGMAGIGQNMQEYVLKNISGNYAYFLTMFERPTWLSVSRCFLSFIYDEDFGATVLRRHQQDVDVNGVNVGTETVTNLLTTEIEYVNNMILRAPNAGATMSKVWIETDADERVTEIKEVDILDCIPESPMQLMWLNKLGGMDTWVFSRHQEISLDISETDQFEPVIDYLQTSNSRQKSLGKESFTNINLGYEQLTTQQVIGITPILDSPLVYAIVDGSNWVQVVVKAGTFKVIDTGESRHKLEFDITLPKTFTQSL